MLVKRLVPAALFLGIFLPCVRGEDDIPSRARKIEKEMVDLVTRVSRAYVMIGGGSGVVITPDGWMLTNNHVIAVQRTKKVWSVMLPIRKPYTADLTGRDVTGDLALLKIRGVTNLPYIPLGDSDRLKPGDLVVALGNPFSHAFRTAEPTVTYGIVSAIHRNQGTYSDAIQTDAPINPGNSGGPLINLKGALVGINGRGLMRFFSRLERNNTGVALAIPTNQIKRFLPLLEKGDVWHGEIKGLTFQKDERRENTLVVDAITGEDAQKAGFKVGDRIVAVGGQPVWNFQRYQGAIHAHPEGARVPIRVLRDGAETELKAKLGRWVPERQRPPPEGELKPGLGAKMKKKAPVTGGAEIEEVLPNSAASRGGLLAGDIIIAFDGKQVLGPGHLKELIKQVYQEIRNGTRNILSVRLKYMRGLEEKEISVALSRVPPKGTFR
jgi:serine protease Do